MEDGGTSAASGLRLDGMSAEVAAWRRLRRVRGFIFDMDGVLYRGAEPLPAVAAAFAAIKRRGGGFMLATNNSMSTPASYVQKLAGMGLIVPAEAILTSALATKDHLAATLPAGAPVLVIGMPALSDQLFAGAPFRPVADAAEAPAAVVVGLDLMFDYAKLKVATAAIRGGARFVATNADATLPTELGLVPGAGSIVAAISVASGHAPEVIGKPGTPLLDASMARLGVGPAESVMIGDRLDTDILAGQRAGMLTVLVLTGVSTRAEATAALTPPDLVIDDLTSLVAELERTEEA